MDRIEIDQSKCIQCGDCVNACMAENPVKHALTTVVRDRFEAVAQKQEIVDPTPVQTLLAMGQAERKAFWHDHFRRCIKCYGCVDICPVQMPGTHGSLEIEKWVPRGEVPPVHPLFHLIRAFQIWDTCVLCGDCEQTCPAGIPLKTLQDVVRFFSPEEVFDLVPGLPEDAQGAIIDYVNSLRADQAG
ncbi:4Fe-4S binding domain protein [delta proteobacterium NaphS2]|nr:4Fe-4S binding domain protein [delta proteobacterium NaphS2]